MVLWHMSPTQTVMVLREDADALIAIIEAFDSIPFAWKTTRGYIFVLMPRAMWAAAC